MQRLNPNWVTEGLIDFEYKKYLLLAYLQWISQNFNESKLYPFLSDLIFHYENLVSIHEKKGVATNKFPKRISKIDLENFRLEYEKMVEGTDYMETIGQILDYAIPRIKSELKNGKELYEFVESKLLIEPVGIVPINNEVGYIFLQLEREKATKVYEYEITIFENVKEKYRGIRTQYISSYTRSLVNTFESIKLDLIRNCKALPNPATYLISCPLAFPLEATLLPIAKRSLVRYLARENGGLSA